MTSPVLAELPSSFDPAVFLHSEINDPPLPIIPPSQSNSDDLEALQQLQEEATDAKNKQGIVIQHRAWKLAQVFRSEEDHPPGQLSRSFPFPNTVGRSDKVDHVQKKTLLITFSR